MRIVALVAAFSAATLPAWFPDPALSDEPIDIGSRREPFVDSLLISERTGTVTQTVVRPEPREVVFVTDAPWEGNTSAYYTIIRDGDLLRMYYRGSHYDTETKQATHPEVTCYAESRDGIHWDKPNLGLVEFEGSTENNIIWDGVGTHCFTPFLDTHPDCPPESRYKALSRGRPQAAKGLYAFRSPDGIHWEMIREEAVIVDGAFDSQNLAFYDPTIGKYRAYHRDFRPVDGVRVRDIKWQVSDDFLNWTAAEYIEYGDGPYEQLYTNAIRPEPLAPHLLIGFPTRYLPQENSRVEPTFMASRDGKTFRRWLDPVIPESAPLDRSGNRSNYMANGLVALPQFPGEYSVYASEAYYTGPDSRLRRFAYRTDGYVAIRASGEGTLVTKPIVFDGDRLTVNVDAGKEGSVVVELLGPDGVTLRSEPITGDHIDAGVEWVGPQASLAELAGKPVTLRFLLRDASLYAMQFHR